MKWIPSKKTKKSLNIFYKEKTYKCVVIEIKSYIRGTSAFALLKKREIE